MEDISSSITENIGLLRTPILRRLFGNGDIGKKGVTTRYMSRGCVTSLLLILLLLLYI